MRISRSLYYYESTKDDTALIKELRRLAEKLPNRGFDTYYNRLRNEGLKCSRSRLLRVYREMGLVRRPKKRKKLPDAERKPLYIAQEPNEIWSMDFMSDSLTDKRTLRVLNIIDDYNRECLVSHGSVSYPSTRVIDRLEELKSEKGLPKYIRTDNGPEFISSEYLSWCKKHDVSPVYSSPGKPMENGYIERFNRTFREDVLDANYFSDTAQFNLMAELWMDDYNQSHPHKSLGYQSPKEYLKQNQKQEFSNLALSEV